MCWGCDVTSPDGYLTSQRLGVTDFPAVVLVAVAGSERKIVARLEGAELYYLGIYIYI